MSNQFQYPFNPIEWQASPKDYSGDNQLGIYAIETTQRHIFGRRYITWDGKVFKYCHALDTIYAGRAAWNGAGTDVSALINSTTPAAYSIGDRQIKVTIASTEGYSADGVIDEDELAGAYIVIGHGSATTTENRTVIGNTAVGSGGGTTIVTLDYPLAVAHSSGVACELPLNPYGYCLGTSLAAVVQAAVSVPCVYVTSGYNFWGQTWGPCWITPGGADSSIGNTANDRMAYFVGDGTVNGGEALSGGSLASHVPYQPAGFIIDGTEVGTGCMPLVMLQLSI